MQHRNIWWSSMHLTSYWVMMVDFTYWLTLVVQGHFILEEAYVITFATKRLIHLIMCRCGYLQSNPLIWDCIWNSKSSIDWVRHLQLEHCAPFSSSITLNSLGIRVRYPSFYPISSYVWTRLGHAWSITKYILVACRASKPAALHITVTSPLETCRYLF